MFDVLPAHGAVANPLCCVDNARLTSLPGHTHNPRYTPLWGLILVRAHMKYPAPSRDEIALVERTVGAPLPIDLIALYNARGNGGFGPDYGLLGLASGHTTDEGDTALSLYRVFNSPDAEDPSWVWPSNMLPILHLGCAIYCCIDLVTPGNPVVQFDPNPFGPGDTWDRAFSVVSPTIESWLGGL